MARRSFGKIDIVVDVQNGLPFFTKLLAKQPVVVLVHHVHREQWPVVYPGITGRVGWWIESRLAPRLYRNCQYVAVSQATRAELIDLGVDGERISVVHNGTDAALPIADVKTKHPSVCVVGRLVPHKQVEHAIDAAIEIRESYPDLVVRIVGDGWWAKELRAYADSRGAADTVVFEGHVSEERKQEIYAESWMMALPSLKEGWGLVIGEAGRHGTPTVAYRAAGGTQESIRDHVSGLLVNSPDEMTAAMTELIRHPERRAALAMGAREMGRQFAWELSQASFATVLDDALAGKIVSVVDPGEQAKRPRLRRRA